MPDRPRHPCLPKEAMYRILLIASSGGPCVFVGDNLGAVDVAAAKFIRCHYKKALGYAFPVMPRDPIKAAAVAENILRACLDKGRKGPVGFWFVRCKQGKDGKPEMLIPQTRRDLNA